MTDKQEAQKEGQYQPSIADMEEDVSIPTTPDKLLRAVMNRRARKTTIPKGEMK